MSPAPRRRRGRQLALACPNCLLLRASLETLVSNAIVSLAPADQLRPDQVEPPFVRYRCGRCGWEEIHDEAPRAKG